MLKLFQKLLVVPVRTKTAGRSAVAAEVAPVKVKTGESLTPDWELGLIPHAQRWLERLPPEQRPAQLCLAFPRIGNKLSLLWPSASLVDRYFDDLLVDKRGGRRGFGEPITSELTRLREFRLLSGDLNDSFFGEPDDIECKAPGTETSSMEKTSPGFQALF